MDLGYGFVCFMLNLSISDDVLGGNVGAAIIRIGFFLGGTLEQGTLRFRRFLGYFIL